MSILSPVMSFVVDKEMGFPTPSEKEKINRALKRYRRILEKHPQRIDAPEILFGVADLLVGRGEVGDYAEASKVYDAVLLRAPSEYLRARALVGKAELFIGEAEEFDNAISLCERARKILGEEVFEFFSAKTFIIEAELRLARKNKEDWKQALKLIDKIIKEKKAHWYFRGRALLSRAEISLYEPRPNFGRILKLIDAALEILKSRPDDYFSRKGKVLKAEVLIRRGEKADLLRAEKILAAFISRPSAYQDLAGRAKLALVEIVKHPKADQLLKEVQQMEGLDPYLAEKAALVAKTIKEKRGSKK